MDKVVHFCKFIGLNFGPLLIFYLINQFWGFKIGVIVSILVVCVEYIYLKLIFKKINLFYYFSSGVIVIFGLADLFFQTSFFLKFEACLTNLLFAVFFGISLFKEKSIVQEFAENQKKTSVENSEDKKYFFKLLTVFWCGYFIFKAFFYLWINYQTSMNEALIIRIFVGKISFWIMMFISVGLPHHVWRLLQKLKLFPSQRNSNP